VKKLYVLFIVFIFSFLVVSCGQHSSGAYSENTLTPESTEVFITVPDNVTEVIISPRFTKEMTFTYTDVSKIDAVVSYIKELGSLTKATATAPELFVGAYDSPLNYEITLNTSDGNTEVYYLLGNNYFKQGQDGAWGDISYETRMAFRDIVQENEADVPARVPIFRETTITVPENITAVMVYNTADYTRKYWYTDSEKVNAIVSYISDLGTLVNMENSGYYGAKTVIVLYAEDGTSQDYHMLGDYYFLQGENTSWYNIKAEDALRFREVLEKYDADVVEK